MIEQCRVSERSQILPRLAGCGDGASDGTGGLSRPLERPSSLLSGTDAVAASRLVGTTGRCDEGTSPPRYILIDIASMAKNAVDEKGDSEALGSPAGAPRSKWRCKLPTSMLACAAVWSFFTSTILPL